MNENKYKITDEELERVLLSSAASLPDSPSERGIRAKGIKRTFSEPLRLLTEYINAKLRAIRYGGDQSDGSYGDGDGYTAYGENINGLSMWLDSLYRAPSGKELINLVSPSEAVIFDGARIQGNILYTNEGANVPIVGGDRSLTLSVSCGSDTYPACLLTLWESNTSYMSVYKISDTLCRILYRSSVLSEAQSYDFSIKGSPLTHITAVKRDDNVTVYADGGLISVIEIPLFEPDNLRIGKDISDTPFPVFIRSLRLLKRPLAPSEVSREYSSYKARGDAASRDMCPVFDLPLCLSTSIRELFERTVRDIRVEMNNDTFTLSFMPLSAEGKELLSAPHRIDLPLEEMIVGGEYVDTSGHPASLMLSLRSGSNIYIPVGNLIKGLTHAEDFLALEKRVAGAESRVSLTESSAFYGAGYDSEDKCLSFYPQDHSAPVGRLTLDGVASEPLTKAEGSSVFLRRVSEKGHRIKVRTARKNKIVGIFSMLNIEGEISSFTNEIIFRTLGDSNFRLKCEDMVDKELYTLSFTANSFTGSFSLGVYNKDHKEIIKGGRNSISFIYDASADGGHILVNDGSRSAVNVVLSEFTLVRGAGDKYIPIAPWDRSITLEACGKNLLDISTLASIPVVNGSSRRNGNSITLTSSSSDCYTSFTDSALRIPVSSGDTICFSWETSSDTVSGTVYMFGNGSTDSMVSCSSHIGRLIYTVPEGVSYITYRIGVGGNGNSLTYSNMQIERGAAPGDYEPYVKGESLSLPLNGEGYMTSIRPCMTVFTREQMAVCYVEFIKEGSVANAIDLMLTDVKEDIAALDSRAFITSGSVEYSESSHQILLKLFSGSQTVVNLDISGAIGAYIAEEFFGGK